MSGRNFRFYLCCCVFIVNLTASVKSQTFGTGVGNSCKLNTGGNGICADFDDCDLTLLYKEGPSPAVCGYTGGDAVVCCPQGASQFSAPSPPQPQNSGNGAVQSQSVQSTYQVLTEVLTEQWILNQTVVVRYKQKNPDGTIQNVTKIENVVKPVKEVVSVNVTNLSNHSMQCKNCPSKMGPSNIDTSHSKSNSHSYMFVNGSIPEKFYPTSAHTQMQNQNNYYPLNSDRNNENEASRNYDYDDFRENKKLGN